MLKQQTNDPDRRPEFASEACLPDRNPTADDAADSRLEVLATNAVWSLARHLLSRGTLFASTIVVARMFTSEELASYVYFQLTVAMIAAWGSAGTGVASSRVFAEHHSGGEQDKTAALDAVRLLSVAMSCLAALAVLCIPVAWLALPERVPKWLFAAGAAAVTLTAVPAGAVIGTARFKLAARVGVLSGIALLVTVAMAGWLHSITVAMAGIVFWGLIQAVGDWRVATKGTARLRARVTWRQRVDALTVLFSLSIPMAAVSILSASANWLLARVILLASGERELALYGIGLQWFALGLVLPGVISQVSFLPIVRRRVAKAASASTRALILRSAWSCLAVTGVVLVGFLIAGRYIFGVYGPEYARAWWIGAVFLMAALIYAPINVVGNAIVAADGQLVWLALTALAVAVMVLVGIVFGEHGAVAGALALCAGGGTHLGSGLAEARRRGLI